MNRQKHTYAFTLIELLVVVAIIAVLMAILIPSLSKAKQNAQSSVCLSNLKQLGLGTQMYQQENNGMFPYPTTSAGETTLWFTALDGYLGPQARDNPDQTGAVGDRNFRRFKQCPVWASISTAVAAEANTSNQTIQQYTRTIKMNVNLHRPTVNGVKMQARIGDVEQPVDFVTYGDGIAPDLVPWGKAPVGDYSGPGAFAMDVTYYITSSTSSAGISSPGLRHAGGANMGFVDGHAANIRLKTQTINVTTTNTALAWMNEWLDQGGSPVKATGAGKLKDPIETSKYRHNPDMPLIWSKPGTLYH